MKKGILLTLASYIMAVLIFLLAVIIFRNTQQSEERFSELVISDRVFDLHGSVENSVKELFGNYFPINISLEGDVYGTNVTFEQNISKSREKWRKQVKKFIENLEAFTSYTTRTESHIDISKQAIGEKNFMLTILPHNINYTWDPGKGKIEVNKREGKRRRGRTTEIKFYSYDVVIYTHGLEIEEFDSHPSESENGEFTFSVVAYDDHGNYHDFETQIEIKVGKHGEIKLAKDYEIEIDLEGHGDDDVEVKLKKDMKLEIKTKREEEITATTTVDRLEKTEEGITIGYPLIRISTDFSEFDIVKNSTINLIQF